MTTFTSYGEVPEHRQGEIMRSLAPGAAGAGAATAVRLDDDQVKQIMEGLVRQVGAKLDKD